MICRLSVVRCRKQRDKAFYIVVSQSANVDTNVPRNAIQRACPKPQNPPEYQISFLEHAPIYFEPIATPFRELIDTTKIYALGDVFSIKYEAVIEILSSKVCHYWQNGH